MTIDKALAEQAKSWAFQEAVALVKRYEKAPPAKGYVLFETGYGPSGLPHIGTFGEVARTSMVRHAFQRISDIPTRLIAFSDDMDGLRKVPENLPNPEMIAANLGKPLTSVPDPFGTHASFGAHMNNRLCEFLDHFGFEYEFKSSTETYKSGEFDATLLILLERYQQVMDLMLPTLGEERQQTYSPFLPVSPRSGKVLLAKVVETNPKKGTIVYLEEDGSKEEVPVTGGHCKLQWKPDMGMRWAALSVDYEMYGKDHLASAELYSAICRIAGGNPPNQFCYELFLDEKGQKISKSKGNGITIDEWLRYAPQESLAYYMFQSPRKAKRLYFDVIPQQVDDYLTFLEKFAAETDEAKKLDNPVWHIHNGNPPKPESGLKFSLLLNLASVCNPHDKSVLWGFISRYIPQATPATCPFLDRLAAYAVTYYHDFIKPTKHYRAPDATERAALQELHDYLLCVEVTDEFAANVQNKIYEIGKNHPFTDLKLWFGALYEILLGQSTGPRMGSFIALYGREQTADLISKVLKGESLAA
ncbi:MAG TPA: lysine--tRNA ligase [Rickettsiales bacterium]|nr:lysine--tRNA ligase [Rickettsiales bacterium]